jgi:hypothetical protein
MQADPVKKTPKNSYYLVQCSCGAMREVISTILKKGKSTRCKECAQKRFHDKFINPPNKPFKYRGNPTHNTWRAMIQRCRTPSNNRYYCYGARGITVCERWLQFENFLEDMGERPQGMQLDRIDTDGDYSKDNCRWVTAKENCNNRNLRSTIAKGSKYGEWEVLGLVPGYKVQHYVCKCSCGIEKVVRASSLKSEQTRSCTYCKGKRICTPL